ncbi:MAG: VPLPA-CTERM sorting domain-containing protein [Steroidobacteraceae bacterium]
MNIIVKSAVAGALSLGATTGAFALGIPATNTSDLVLVIQNLTATGNVYALDTGLSINSEFSGTYVTGATLNTSLSALNSSIAASTTLQAFLTANPASGDGWVIEAGQYAGATSNSNAVNSNTKNAGSAKAIFTSVQPAANIGSEGITSFQSYLNGLQGDISTTGGLAPLLTSTENDTAVAYSSVASGKYGMTPTGDLGSLGSSQTLFAYTGNNSTSTNIQSYILGTATLSSTGQLVIAGNSGAPVPIPAALWLFGSGVLGLVGVSRRRRSAV